MKKNKNLDNKEFTSCTAKDLFRTMNELAGSAKLRAETEEWFRKKGIDITIDKCGLASLYTPLHISVPTNFPAAIRKWNKTLYGSKKPFVKLQVKDYDCKCENCVSSKKLKAKCFDCGKNLTYVHAIGWECTDKQCHKKRQDKLIAHFNSKSDTEKLLMANFVPLSHKDHMLLHKKNGKKVCSDAEYKTMKKASDAGNYV
jgi:hypothetical protein